MQPIHSVEVITLIVRNEITKQTKFARETFDLGDDWEPKVTITFKSDKMGSSGGIKNGKPVMTLGLYRYLYEAKGLLEYSTFSWNPFIGSFRSDDLRTCLAGLVAHEISHCVQYSLPFSNSKLKQKIGSSYVFGSYGSSADKAHGTFFQRIYKQFRVEFVNHRMSREQIGINPDASSIEIMKKYRRTEVGSHPLIGIKFNHRKYGACEIVEYRLRASRFPIVFKTSDNIKVKTNALTLSAFTDIDPQVMMPYIKDPKPKV